MPSRLLEVWDLARALDLAPNQYMAKYEPEFGPIAYEDIIDLTEHVRRAFPEVTSKTPAYELGFFAHYHQHKGGRFIFPTLIL